MIDEIFGPNSFRNEIILSYKRYTAASKRFQRLHDTLLFYSKTNSHTFNEIRESYSSKSGKADSHYKQDENGRWFRWQKRKEQEPYKVYLSEGRRLGDVWEMPIINASAKERLGYPTQKPETLLERIIKVSSNKGDIVLDAFCGCGTTLVVAQKLGRNWMGIDISPTATKVMERRLANVGAIKDRDYVSIGMPTTVNDLRQLKPFEFQNWVINEMGARHSRKKVDDKGIDGYFVKDLWHEEASVQVKQSNSVGRPAIDNFKAALERKKYKKGYIVAFSFTKGVYEEVARAKHDEGLDIKLVEVEVLLLKKKPIE